MKIVATNETETGESRTSLTPENAKKLVDLGASLHVESGLGTRLHIGDNEYENAGCTVVSDRESLYRLAELIMRVGNVDSGDLDLIPEGCIIVGHLDPFNQIPTIRDLARHKITSFSVEMIPRTTRAQKMDALSSQASLAGYNAVILAAERLNRVFPMMMTPAGTISPARVFVIGAGVAGLQAIATAKRLGARVEAFDTRPAVAEQVQSLGARFVKIDLGETGQTRDGYARSLTPEQLQLQRDGMAKICGQCDVVITTAQVFGRPAPRILTQSMIAQMKPGSIVVDMAAESGGNVEGSRAGEEVDVDGVRIIGARNLPGLSAVHASQMYSNNLFSFIQAFWDNDQKVFCLNRDDEIIRGCLITHDGEVVNETILSVMEKSSAPA